MKAHRSQLLAGIVFALSVAATAQTPPPATTPDNGAKSAAGTAGRVDPNAKGETKPNGVEGSAGPDVKHGAADSDPSFNLPSIAASPAPPNTTGRPRIGLALGGGGALGLSEVGVLQWLEDHHVPVDVIAGTSMGCMVSALYSTGRSPDQLKTVMNDTVFNSVFTFGTKFQTRSFRRREDDRALPNALSIGLKHGVSLRNSVLTDQGLNAFLDREFLRYDDRIDFNTLPIPLRCISTDVTAARSVTFSNGSLPDAVRASISIPGVFRPFDIGGHQFVDGAVLNNLPTQTIHDMKADVVLAVSLPIAPLGKEDLNSLLGVLQRSFGVAIEGNERESRRLADVVMIPDVSGFNQTAYLKGTDLAKRGYEVAELHKNELLKYAVNNQQWQAYLDQRTARLRGPAGKLQQVIIKAPNDDVTRAVQRKFAGMVGQPVDTKAIEAALDEIRSDGRYDADYTVGHAEGESNNAIQNIDPVIRVAVTDKTTGPPFLLVGTNIEAQTSGVTRATLESILLWQDLGGYGSELRANIKVGFLTQIDAEYYRRVHNTGHMGGFFVAPYGGILRSPFDIYVHQVKISERLLQRTGGGVDAGWSDSRKQEVRLGWEGNQVRWQTQIGADTFAPTNLIGGMQRVRLRYVFDNQDRALVPQYGVRITTEAAYLYDAVGSVSTPVFTNQFALAHQIGKNLFLFQSLAGTMLHRNVSQPFLFTLGGPQRLSASAIDEYRGTDYFLLEPVFLRRIAKLPDPLGQSIYAGVGYEAGQMRAPNTNTQTRQDIYFGIVAETPLGVITLAPAIGDDGHRKFTFTLGKLF
jgi:NTE family protein